MGLATSDLTRSNQKDSYLKSKLNKQSDDELYTNELMDMTSKKYKNNI